MAVGLAVLAAPVTAWASDWNAQTHTLAIGDFDGDRRSDLLYIAKDPSQASGIALSDGTAPVIDHQSWPSNHLGIPWHSGNYNPVVADFNGDTRADLLLQATAPGGWSFLLYATLQGRFESIAQTIPAYCQGLYWPASDHRIIAGNFAFAEAGDPIGTLHRRELLLQATRRAGTNAIVRLKVPTAPAGAAPIIDCGATPLQIWGDGHANFQWSTNQALVHAGDFNNDGYDDVLVQAKPDFTMIDYDIPFPVPTYRPGSFGIVLGSASGLQSSAWQFWDRMEDGIDWSAANTNVVIGDFDDNDKADILLQSKRSGGTNRWFAADETGRFTPGASTATLSGELTGDAYVLLAAKFAGSTNAAGLYRQVAFTGGGPNGVAASIGGGFASHDYASVQPATGTNQQSHAWHRGGIDTGCVLGRSRRCGALHDRHCCPSWSRGSCARSVTELLEPGW